MILSSSAVLVLLANFLLQDHGHANTVILYSGTAILSSDTDSISSQIKNLAVIIL
jgi:hypothetical protein